MPERLCITCREPKQKNELLRVVGASIDGVDKLYLDLRGKLQGRGAYVCNQGPCFQLALQQGRFARSLKININPDMETELIKAWELAYADDLEARILNLIGLGRRSKRLVCGAQGVSISIRRQKAKLVVMAKDTAENTINEVTTLCKHNGVPYFLIADKELLGRLTGQDFRAVIAVENEELSQGIKALLEQWHQNTTAATEADFNPGNRQDDLDATDFDNKS